MQKDLSLYEVMTMPDPYFAVKLTQYSSKINGHVIFESHWHEHIEILYFKKGTMLIECNNNPLYINPGEIIVINSNDLHRGTNICTDLDYYCIILDASILNGKSVDICDTKYITPIVQNHIAFENKITNDKVLSTCLDNLIKEYTQRDVCFELAVKSCLYQILVLLLRNHSVSTMTFSQYKKRIKNLEIFNPLFQYMEGHYNEELNIDMLCKMINMSKYYFCHSFKEFTGKTLSEYLNVVRINKAEYMLKNSDLNVSEVATSCGFNDINYFSRVYKKYKKISPSKTRREA